MKDLRKSAYKGSALLTAGQVVVYGSSFVRNMVLARLLTKADFGTAAALAMVIQLLEFTASIGVARFVVRDKDGGEPEFQATAQMMQWSAGLLSGVLILLASWPLAHLFGLAEHRWAMAALAVVPVLNGWQHLDVRRYERDLRFGPSALVEMVPQLVITAAAWPVAMWLKDFRAMLLLMLVKAVASCAASHWLAERPYRWGRRPDYVRRMLKFGWPLVLNGFLMFGALHGDQFLVATFYTMTELGPYAGAASLVMAPTFFFGRVFNSLMLPLLAKEQDDPERFTRRYRQTLAVLCSFAAVCAVGLIVGAESVMRLVYGAKYAGSGPVLAALATANAFRNVRIAPALASMAKGDSKNQLISSLWRMVALVPALGAALTHQPVWVLASFGVVGEALAGWSSMVRLKKRDGVPLQTGMVPLVWVSVVVLVGAGLQLWTRQWGVWGGVVAAAAASVGVVMGSFLLLGDLRSEVKEFLSRWRRRSGAAAASNV